MTLSNALDYIFDLQRIGIKFGLANTRRLLKALGNPHLNYKIIHISGTNGKGSTAAMISSILKAGRYKVGLYTSPHFIHLSERIQINGHPISETDLIGCAEKLRQITQALHFKDSHPTYFETVTCMAFSYFAQKKVDWVVLEVGMGGRWDATNVCVPEVSVITNIALDHQIYLGHTLTEIAKEKAGIIKKGRPVVSGATQEEVLAVIRKKCQSVGAPLYLISELYTYDDKREPHADTSSSEKEKPLPQIHIRREGNPYLTITPILRGKFQIQNTLLALEVIERLKAMGMRIDEMAIKNGLCQTVWPGRVQVVSQKPYLVLDGAHNPTAAQKLVETIQTQFHYHQLILVLGILKDKDIEGICRAIVPFADHVILSEPHSDRSASAEELYQVIQSCGLAKTKSIETRPRLSEAILRAKGLSSNQDLILITGSLYTVGDAMAYLDIQPYPHEVKRVVPL